jgi:import receptor subunit TOM20
LIANRDIKKGEELTMAYVSVDKKDADGVEEGRRKRRYELARGWGFACICKRCVAEGPEGKKGKEIDEGVKLAEVGVDPAVAKFENKASAS